MSHKDVTLLDTFGFCGGNAETLTLIGLFIYGLSGSGNLTNGQLVSSLDGCQDIRAVTTRGDSNKDIARLRNASQFSCKDLLKTVVVTNCAEG